MFTVCSVNWRVPQKTKQKKKIKPMNMVAGRLAADNAEWLPHFLERTGTTQAKVLNEALRIAREPLERRLSTGGVLFTAPNDPHHHKTDDN
jgi:hypothetical protein